MCQAERNAERESITKIEVYKKAEKHIFREIFKRRSNSEGVDHSDYYAGQEGKLVNLILVVKGDLLDIEMALQQTLESARGQFFNEIKRINEEMAGLTTEAFQSISSEFAQFGIKLKEDLNKEKESFAIKVETDEQSALEEYGVLNMEQSAGTALETILDDNKDAVDELVTTFIEKIEVEAGQKEGQITKGRNSEWIARTGAITEQQHNRGR